jgi:hypothetical protein
MSDRTTHSLTALAHRAVAVLAATVVATLVVTATSGAISARVVDARDASRAQAVTALGTLHIQTAADLRSTAAGTRLAGAVRVAQAEVARARHILTVSAGKAAPAGRSALAAAIASVTALSGSSAYRLTGAVMSLREAEKAVTDSVAAWERAEQARLAAAAAARAAAIAAAEYSAHLDSTTSPAGGGGSVTTHAATVAHYAPGVSSTRPDNTGCGPCPGATLVLTPSGYWGCP